MDFILASVESDYGGEVSKTLLEEAYANLKKNSFNAQKLSITMDDLDHGQLNTVGIEGLRNMDENTLECMVARATVGTYNARLSDSGRLMLGMNARNSDNSICPLCKDISEIKCKRDLCACARSGAETPCDIPCEHRSVKYRLLCIYHYNYLRKLLTVGEDVQITFVKSARCITLRSSRGTTQRR